MLERAGLVTIGQDAQRRPRRLEGEPMTAAIDWLERYRAIWATNYARLDALLLEMRGKPAPMKRRRRRL